MRILVLFILALQVSGPAHALPNTPQNVCLSGCTAKMEEIYANFFAQEHPLSLEPAVYSGDCYFKSRDYHGDQAHRAMVLVDDHPSKPGSYFATSFMFFGAKNEYADWGLERARKEAYGAWNNYGPIQVAEQTFRVAVNSLEGNPVWVYYARQNPVSKVVSYISLWGVLGDVTFCELNPNER
jgi:hypothetical protein